jgi:hypothetical protein
MRTCVHNVVPYCWEWKEYSNKVRMTRHARCVVHLTMLEEISIVHKGGMQWDKGTGMEFTLLAGNTCGCEVGSRCLAVPAAPRDTQEFLWETWWSSGSLCWGPGTARHF